MNSSLPVFREPTPVEKTFNRVFGFLVGIGFPFSHKYLLQVRGRKSGNLYSTPINLMEWKGRRFLVAPRGRTQWVRNAEAAGAITLKKGGTLLKFHLLPVGEAEAPEILKFYLDSFKSEVQRYFPVAAGSPAGSFVEIAGNYPVFELVAG